MSELAYRPYAVRLMLGLLAAFAVVVVHSHLTHARRVQLESYSETTAVGDKALYPRDENAPPLRFQGRLLVPTILRPYDPRESRMHPAGKDESGQFHIYLYTGSEPIDPHPGDAERPGEPVYFIKIGVNEFLKVQPAAK